MVRFLFSLRWSGFNHGACELDDSFGFLLGRQQQQKLRAILGCVGG